MNQAFQTGFPQQPQSYQQFYTVPSQRPFPDITKEEIKLYQTGFKNICGGKGHLSGKEGRDILMKTQLPVPTLRKIWELSDPLATGIMKEEQFIIAMHIIANVRSNGCEVPDVLPDSLKRLVFENKESSPLPPPQIKEMPKPEKPPSPKPALKVIEFKFPSMDQFSVNPTPNPPSQPQPTIQKHSKTNSLRSTEDVPLSEEVSISKNYVVAEELKKIIKEKEIMIDSKNNLLRNLKDMIEYDKNELDLFKQKNKQIEMKIREQEDSHTKMQHELATAKIKFEDGLKKKDDELNEIKNQLAELQEINRQLKERKMIAQQNEQHENYAVRQEIEKPKYENKPETVEKKIEAFNFNAPSEKFNFSQKDNRNAIEAKNEMFEFNAKARPETEAKQIKPIKAAAVETKPSLSDFQFDFSTNESKIESSALSSPPIPTFDFEVKVPAKETKVIEKQIITPEIKISDKKAESPTIKIEQDNFKAFPEISNKKPEYQMFDFNSGPIASEDKSIKPSQSDKKNEPNSFQFEPPKPVLKSEGFGFDFTNVQKIEDKITPMFDFNIDITKLENKKPVPAKEASIFDFPKDALVQRVSPVVEQPKNEASSNVEIKIQDQKNEMQFSSDSKSSINQFSQSKNELDWTDKSKDLQSSIKMPPQNFSFDMPKEIKSNKDSKSSFPTIRSESPESSFKSEPVASSSFSFDMQKPKETNLDPFNFSPEKPVEQLKFPSDLKEAPKQIISPPQIKIASNIDNLRKEIELKLDESSSSSSESLEYENEKADFDFDLKPEDIPQPKAEFGFGGEAFKTNTQPKPEFDLNQSSKDNPQPKMEFDFNKDAPKAEFSQALKTNTQPKMEFEFKKDGPKADFDLAPKDIAQPKAEFDFNKDSAKVPQFDFNKGFAQPPQFDFNKGAKADNQLGSEFEFGKEISQPKAEKNPSFSFEFKPDDIKFDPQFEKFNGQGFDFQSASIANAFKGDLFKIETSAIKPRKSPTDLEFD